MKNPVIVSVEFELENGGFGSEVYMFINIKKAIEFGKNLVGNYLKEHNFTTESFNDRWDTLEIEEWENGYSFVSWHDGSCNRYNVHVYEGTFEDAQQDKEAGEEFFSIIRWSIEDVISCFKERGIPVTDRNIETFLKSHAPKVLTDRSIEEGNIILSDLISAMEFQLEQLA